MARFKKRSFRIKRKDFQNLRKPKMRGYKTVTRMSLTSDGELKRSYAFQKRDRTNGSSAGIFGFILIILIVFALLAEFRGTEQTLSFYGLLEFFSNAPVVSTDWITSFSELTIDEWVGFEWLREFILNLKGIVEILLFACNGLVQLALYIIYFVRLFFV